MGANTVLGFPLVFPPNGGGNFTLYLTEAALAPFTTEAAYVRQIEEDA